MKAGITGKSMKASAARLVAMKAHLKTMAHRMRWLITHSGSRRYKSQALAAIARAYDLVRQEMLTAPLPPGMSQTYLKYYKEELTRLAAQFGRAAEKCRARVGQLAVHKAFVPRGPMADLMEVLSFSMPTIGARHDRMLPLRLK